MMRSTGLLSIKSLASKIHPQLPLNRKESQHLLTVLQTAFRKQLDLQHPPVDKEGRKPNTAHPTAPSSRDEAVRHLEAVLSSPFLGPRSTATPRNGFLPSDTPLVDSAALLIQNPAQWFQGRIDDGSADLKKAKICLQTLVGDDAAIQKRSSPFEELIRKSELGSKIYNWMCANGIEDDTNFHQDRTLSYLLTVCLVAENQNQIVLNWACRLLNEKSTWLTTKESLRYGQFLVEAYIKAKVFLKVPLQVVMDDFMQIIHSLHEKKWSRYHRELYATGRYINKLILTSDGITESLFDKWVKHVPFWATDGYFTALLKLHHPKVPQARAAFAYIAELPRLEVETRKSDRYRMIDFCLATARQLLNEQKPSDALRVLRLTQERYSEELHPCWDASTQPQDKDNSKQQLIWEEICRLVEDRVSTRKVLTEYDKYR